MVSLHSPGYAVLFTGEMPENTAVMRMALDTGATRTLVNVAHLVELGMTRPLSLIEFRHHW